MEAEPEDIDGLATYNKTKLTHHMYFPKQIQLLPVKIHNVSHARGHIRNATLSQKPRHYTNDTGSVFSSGTGKVWVDQTANNHTYCIMHQRDHHCGNHASTSNTLLSPHINIISVVMRINYYRHQFL